MALIIKPESDPTKVLEGTEQKVIDSIVAELSSKPPAGIVIRTADQERTLLSTQMQQAEDKAYSKSRKEVDDMVLELTGIAKATDGHEKTLDYLKRATAEKLKEVTALKSQVDDFKNKGVEGNALAMELKRKNEQLEQLVQQVKKEKDDTLAKYEADIFGSKVDLEINAALGEFRPLMITTTEPKIIDDVIEARVARFKRENKAAFSQSDKMVTWADPVNSAIRLNKDDAKPSATKVLLRNYFEDLFDKGKQQGGAGSGGNGKEGGAGANGKDNPAWKSIKLPAEVKARTQLYEFLKNDQKMAENTKEFNEAFDALGKDLPIRPK